ncbi:Amine oxidase [Aspergillus mulundensis]|uniref:Amine oxidase n=1 Tax=Aspergillus mulundensis TaxID=1810919 RepID=A0A3D8RYG6_9EURO|nr:Amine oxidase [Aspergillus mulundensis]RDW79092.1 Amine oxidase [Aspergillus mulundensis]
MHPLNDLTPAEINAARGLVQSLHGSETLIFKAITLDEPRKQEMVAYLVAEMNGQRAVAPPRLAYCVYYLKSSDTLMTTWINLTTHAIARSEPADPTFHGNVDFDEVQQVEDMVMQDPTVLAEIAKLQLPDHLTVVAEAWGFGSDGGIDDRHRQYQVYMFVSETNNLDSNHYARPLNFSPVVDPVRMVVTRIEMLPTGVDDARAEGVTPYKDLGPNEYIPEAQTLREDLKPLTVAQPEGASFTIDGDNVLRWQKWHFRIGFNYREGIVLRDVRYDNQPLFYRMSLSEMTVPYADPRSPYFRKQAFDLGDVGAGLVANDLRLGCDCLGAIAYLDGWISDRKGRPLKKDNAVCIHEQDNGIGWKHTNYRTGRACVVRNRELVIQSILTVSNYEYILAFKFNQAGQIDYEVRATGILSTCAIDENQTVPFGTIVHPGVLATHHQHILSLRLDPALGSYTSGNQLAYTETTPIPHDAAHGNPHGNGYVSGTTTVPVSGGLDLNTERGRIFSIQNPSIRNPVNGLPASYKIHSPPLQKMLAAPDSIHFRRAEFADHEIYVTKYNEDELFSGGKFTNQSQGGTGIKTWVARQDRVEDEDIVVWVQFGINHVPRIEDFPVMPVEILTVSLKPVNFFTRNPAIDVPPSTQERNCSVRVEVGKEVSGGAHGAAACCERKSLL